MDLRTCSLWVVLITAPPLHASPRSEPSADAETAKDAAYEAFAVSDYETAIREYKRAYRLSNDPRIFYNLALSHRKRFLLEGTRADAVEARDYFYRFAELVDPSSVGVAEERAQLEKMITLARGYVRELEQELARAPITADRDAKPPRVRDEIVAPTRPSRSRPWATILLVTTGALAAGAVTTGVLALGAERDATTAFDTGDLASARTRASDADRYALVTDVIAGAAVITGGIALYLALSRGSSPRATTRATLTVSPVGAALTLRY